MQTIKVLFHVSDQEVWPKAVTNIENYLNDVDKETIEIEVVANAAAVVTYFNADKKELLDRMASLSAAGVKFTACRNALKANKLAEADLPSFVQPIPAGITEIVIRQTEGFVYIKP
ncbi:DsrE family protein [Peptococcaceae bacterium 1198_IL3148]